MNNLKSQISSISPEIMNLIDKRLEEFISYQDKSNEEWFSELCFCILTANSRAKTAINIQTELGFTGFSQYPKDKITETIKRNKHRFHNNKAKYIIEARNHFNIKNKIGDLNKEMDIIKVREWLVNNIKGLGFKEASHFLRNTGHDGIAILDRHILNLMFENKKIENIPKPLNRNKYLEIELKFLNLSKTLDLSPAKLDLIMWYLKTGEVLK